MAWLRTLLALSMLGVFICAATDPGATTNGSGLVPPHDYYIAGFGGPTGQAQRTLIENSGLEIVGYAGNFSYVVRIGHGIKPNASGFSLEPMLKASNTLAAASTLMNETLDKNIVVVLYPGEDADVMLPVISAIAPAQKVDDGVLSVASATDEQLSEIQAVPGVMMADIKKPDVIANDYAAPVLGATAAWSGLGLNGNSTIVAVSDTGLDSGNLSTLHLDFRGRVVGISAWCDGVKLPLECSGNPTGKDLHGHGTHVSGSVLGNGTLSNGAIKGMAPGASLFMQSLYDGDGYIYTPPDLRLLFNESRNANASVESDSWGDSPYSHYSSDSYYIDDYSYKYKDFLIFYAAGNSGPNASTLGSEGQAKNAIVIGSIGTTRYSGNISQISSFSSRGPASDGRYKPDLVAPGEYILSTLANYSVIGTTDPCGWGGYNQYYCFCAGTSMSTPLSAGSATLVRDYLIKDQSIPDPPSALIKAILIAGAEDLPAYGPSPNYVSGFGRINLSKSLPIGNNSLAYATGNLTTGAAISYQYRFRDSQRARFALVWTDPACTSNCNVKALVNDLDLIVTLPNGTIVYGNSRGNASAGPDRINNEEMVELNPTAGIYNVNISGYSVPTPPQDFALAVTGDIDTSNPSISLNSPANLAILNSSTVVFNFTAVDNVSTTMNCSIFLDNALNLSNASTINDTATTFSISAIPDGNHSWYVQCSDNPFNNGTSSTMNFTVDTQPPSVTLNSPNNLSIFNVSSVSFNFTAVDNLSTTLNCSLYMDNMLNLTNSPTSNGTATIITVNSIADGNHTWYVQCKDNAYNAGTSPTRNFMIDTKPPAVTLNSPINLSVFNVSNVTFSFTPVDNPSRP